MKRLWLMVFFFSAVFVFSSDSYAISTGYVSDQLIINLKEDENGGGEITARLKTDDKLEIIKENENSYYVRTKSGAVGWIKKQYVTVEIPKSIIIERLNRENNKLKENISILESAKGPLEKRLIETKKEYETRIKELSSTNHEKDGELKALRKEVSDLNKRYKTLLADSKNTLKLMTENKTFNEENDKLKNEIAILTDDKAEKRKKSAIQWFLAGGGVFLLGLILGGASRRKRYSGYGALR